MRLILIVFLATSLLLPASHAFAGGGMNCGFGSWEGPDETVRLFPTYAVADGKKLVIPVHVWVHEREEDRLRRYAIKAFAEGLGVEEGTPEHDVFRERMVDFMVDNERGKEITVFVGGEGVKSTDGISLGETPANGHLEKRITVKMKRKKMPKEVRIAVMVDGRGRSTKTIKVPVVPREGLTVVSDIDDTIKVTNVLDKKELVANTFTKEFQPVPGMSKYFDKWAEQGATFHYLSASPWNLQAPLQTFAKENGFPSGVYHLRILRLKDIGNTVEFLQGSEPHKLAELRQLLNDFPERRFILVGDSGERDPEIYGTIAREFPNRVQQILIREVPGAKNEKERFANAFQGVPEKVWSTAKH